MRKSILHFILLALFGLGLAGPAEADTAAAKRHMARGAAAMEEAKSPADFRDAVEEFSQAVKQAPEWADAWFNLGVAQESAEDYEGAIKSFKIYLKQAPGAADQEAVQTRIFGLEFKMEKVQKREETEQRAKARVEGLSGRWEVGIRNNLRETPTRNSGWRFDAEHYAAISVRGDKIEIRVVFSTGATIVYKGTISSNKIQGLMSHLADKDCPPFNNDFEGMIWPEENQILIIADGGASFVYSKTVQDLVCRVDTDVEYGSSYLLKR